MKPEPRIGMSLTLVDHRLRMPWPAPMCLIADE
jgi:hypothetical protein